MRALDRKLARDLWRLRGQVASIAAVIGCGVMTVVAMRSTYASLFATREAYYATSRFGSVFASLRRAPDAVVPRIAAIPGVRAVQPRVVQPVTLDVRGLDAPASGRLIGVPAPGGPSVNALHLRRGRFLDPTAGDEVILSDRFAEANALVPGDSIAAVINGRWRRLRIVGIALSPEYTFEAASVLDLFGDPRRFGILWMRDKVVASAFAMTGAFNDVALTLAPGASEQEVITRVDAILRPYGGIGAVGRDEQLSARMLSDELLQLRVFGSALPVIFLTVAAFLLHIVLSRLISTERDIIGILKAFGYSTATVAWHYVRFALAAVGIGALAGVALGVWLGKGYTALYAEFYRFPVLRLHIEWGSAAGAVLVSGGAALLGALGAARRAAALSPAEAMRPDSPPRFRPMLIERLGIAHLVPPSVRMILRNLERRPGRTAASTLGVALAAAMFIMGWFSFDSIMYLMDQQFARAQREDVAVSFISARNESARFALARLPGVTRVEAFRATAVRLIHGPVRRRVGLQSLAPDAELRRAIDADGALHAMPSQGMVLSSILAEVLSLSPGDTVSVQLSEYGDVIRPVMVAGVVDDLLGTAAYMAPAALQRLLREAPGVNGAYLSVGAGDVDSVTVALKRMPAVAGATTREATINSFRDLVAQSLVYSIVLIVSFATVIAIGVVYNGARISYSERARELASLRVLGFTPREATMLLLGEQAIVTVIGIPVGWWLGDFFSWRFAGAFRSELYRLPVVILPRTFLFAALVVAGSAVVAGLLMRRRVYRADIVSVLKTRE